MKEALFQGRRGFKKAFNTTLETALNYRTAKEAKDDCFLLKSLGDHRGSNPFLRALLGGS